MLSLLCLCMRVRSWTMAQRISILSVCKMSLSMSGSNGLVTYMSHSLNLFFYICFCFHFLFVYDQSISDALPSFSPFLSFSSLPFSLPVSLFSFCVSIYLSIRVYFSSLLLSPLSLCHPFHLISHSPSLLPS